MKKTILFSTVLISLLLSCKKKDSNTSDDNNSQPSPSNPVNANTLSDIDGNIYKTITIGTQTWMAENLKVTKYNDGTAITNVSDGGSWSNLTTGAYSWYNNDISNKATYGALYNWHAVNTQKLCPKGWHVPSDEDWTKLETYLANNGYNYDGSNSTTNVRAKIAKALAEKSGWTADASAGAVGNSDYATYRNKSGFAGLPGGFRADNGTFNYVGEYSIWWSASEENPNCAWYRDITYNNPMVDRAYGFKKNGFYVRCIKD
ncbi:MAG: fibrobacter succinogenes major paralogous domain-containing protein [Bacteroidia bacterium]|nr:fibrobacter succinogenes major paralogous domain-containing protein [Bacteroidia bacterium]